MRALQDIKLQIHKPSGPCDPCNVSYAVSAALGPDEYLLQRILVYKPKDLNRIGRPVCLPYGGKTAGFEPKRPEI